MEGWKNIKILVEGNDFYDSFDVYIEDGRVLRATDCNHSHTLYPYRATGHGYELCVGINFKVFTRGYRSGRYALL